MKEVLKKVNSINTIAKPVSKGSVMSKEFHLIVNRIDKKLDAMDDRLNSMNETLIRQEGNLSEHMRRTEALEKIVAPIKEDVQKIKFLGLASEVKFYG